MAIATKLARLVILVMALGAAARARAQGADDGKTKADVQRRTARARQFYDYDHWENGLDVKFTNLFDRKAADIASPTVMLSAQWNYKFPSATYVGVSLSGLPQSHAKTEGDVKHSFTTYYGGLNIAQALLDLDPYRVVLSVAGGEGLLFVRLQSPQYPDSMMNTLRYKFVEPSLYFTFLEWAGVDIGVVVSSRLATLEKTTPFAENKDISSLAYGLTFRSQGQ